MPTDDSTRYSHFDSLIKRHEAQIEHLCLLRAWGDRSLCDELKQECYISIWQHEHQIPVDLSPRQEARWVYWLYRSAFSRHHYLQRALPWVSLDERMADTVAAEDDSQTSELLDTMASVLTPHECYAMELMLQGYSTSEVARILHIRPPSAYQLRHRIIIKLRNHYNNNNKNNES